MKKANDGLNRRNFLKAGLGATAGAAITVGATREAAAKAKTKKVKFKSRMPVRELGKTGVKVPLLGFGGAMIVTRWGGVGTEDDRAAVIRHAYDKGVRWFDTADQYMESETIIGNGLKGVRDNVYIATKVSVLKPEEVRPAVESSLKELQTDYLDNIQIHGTMGIEQMTFEEAMKIHTELVKLRDEGITRFIGLTGHNYFDKLYQLICTEGFDTAFLANGYLRMGMRRVLTNEMVEMREMCLSKAHELNMGILAMKVMRAGMLGSGADPVVPDWDSERLAQLPGAAIRYLLQDERIHIFNIGMRIASDVDYNVDVLSGDTTFTQDDLSLLAEFSAKVYPWYDERMKGWEKRRAERRRQRAAQQEAQ